MSEKEEFGHGSLMWHVIIKSFSKTSIYFHGRGLYGDESHVCPISILCMCMSFYVWILSQYSSIGIRAWFGRERFIMQIILGLVRIILFKNLIILILEVIGEEWWRFYERKFLFVLTMMIKDWSFLVMPWSLFVDKENGRLWIDRDKNFVLNPRLISNVQQKKVWGNLWFIKFFLLILRNYQIILI